VDQTGTAQVAQGAPWEADAEAIGDAVDHGLGELRLDTVAEALPGMPETPGAPAPADQPPPWEQPETDPLDDFDDEPDIEELGAMLGEVMSEMGIDGGAELGALEPWVTPAPAWNFDDTAQSPDLKEDTQPAPDEGADEALNPWFESFLADP